MSPAWEKLMKEYENSPTALVEERNFRVNGEMREKICVIRPVFGRFLREIDMKLLGEMPAKFQNLFRNRNLDS